MSATPDHTELLRRFKPQLRYDSNEAFFADSAREWVVNPGNVLRRATKHGKPGAELAYASPTEGRAQLTLDLLAKERYGTGDAVEPEDFISASGRNYRAMYVRLRTADETLKNRMYGRAKEDSGGRLWLQYWFYYFYNDYSLAGGIGLHEGDWEMVQLRLRPELDRPDLAVYAQHTHAQQAAWEEVEKVDGKPDTALVYVARGSHASYFHAGYHETEAWYDMADGLRETPELRLEIVGDDVPGWLEWPGRWGDTRPRVPLIEQPSPIGPIGKPHWDDPAKLRQNAREPARPAARPKPNVQVRRQGGYLAIAFDFAGQPRPRPERLVLTINSPDDRLPPRTFTFAVEPAQRGEIQTNITLTGAQSYDVSVSTTDADGRPSESSRLLLVPAEHEVPLREKILLPTAGAVYRAREKLARLFRR